MLIYANKRKNGAVDIIFFHWKMRNWYLGSYTKKEGGKVLRIFAGYAKKKKNEMLGPSGPPSSYALSVNSLEPNLFTQFKINLRLTAHNWQKWKRVFLTKPIYTVQD